MSFSAFFFRSCNKYHRIFRQSLTVHVQYSHKIIKRSIAHKLTYKHTDKKAEKLINWYDGVSSWIFLYIFFLIENTVSIRILFKRSSLLISDHVRKFWEEIFWRRSILRDIIPQKPFSGETDYLMNVRCGVHRIHILIFGKMMLHKAYRRK
jgi:hypothetical protein